MSQASPSLLNRILALLDQTPMDSEARYTLETSIRAAFASPPPDAAPTLAASRDATLIPTRHSGDGDDPLRMLLDLPPISLRLGSELQLLQSHRLDAAGVDSPLPASTDELTQPLSSLTSQLAVSEMPVNGPLLSSRLDHGGHEIAASRYDDLGLLGVGGMGEVRRVFDRLLGRPVAIKIIRPELHQNIEAISRFASEVRATARLQHPGIVPVHDAGRLADGRLFFTMKEVKGVTLGELIRQVHQASRAGMWGPTASGWTFRRLVAVFHRVCESIAYAHGHGLVHRDLKPVNIMVGDHGEVLVVDWGLARIGNGTDFVAEAGDLDPIANAKANRPAFFTRADRVTGTPAYMPPEQARADVYLLGPASDVYSLGAILYEMLAGRAPFTGSNPHAVLAQVLIGPPAPPSQRSSSSSHGDTMFSVGLDASPNPLPYAPTKTDEIPSLPIPEELENICLKAMAREISDRYPTAASLAEAIETWLEDAQKRDRALRIVDDAKRLEPEIAQIRRKSDELQNAAARLLEVIPNNAPVKNKRPAWSLEEESARLGREADMKEMYYLQLLRSALTHVPDLAEAHESLADYYLAQHAEAERRGDQRALVRHQMLLQEYARPQHAAYLRGDGAVTLHSDPEAARVTLFPYQEVNRRLVLGAARELGATPLQDFALPMGSYLLLLDAKGRAPVKYPVAIARLDRWDGIPPGASASHPIYLPRTEELGPDDIYVPAGWFWAGAESSQYQSLPLQRVWLNGFVIRRFPVTCQEYLTFLQDLVETGREAEALRYAPRQRAGAGQEQGELIWPRHATQHFEVGVDADGQHWFPADAVTMVDWHCARAYSAWLAQRTNLPWRIPSEYEWEKAAKGADRREYPWGNFADSTWSCAQESFSGKPDQPTVDSFPVDESPYGVRGMAGNVKDWCLEAYRPDTAPIPGNRWVVGEPESVESNPVRITRGGSWLGLLRNQRIAYRGGGLAAPYRVGFQGFRVVRSLSGSNKKKR